MVFEKYDYDNGNYPEFSDEDIERNRYRIVKDTYWNAKNLMEIIEETYDTTKVHGLDNRKEEIIFSLVALVCELYLKSLAYSNSEQVSMVKGHDLSSLYSILPATIKSKIVEMTNESDFEAKLDENKDVFIKFRYSFELKGYRINATFLLNLMNALSKICNEMYPKEITDGDPGFFRCGYAANGYLYSNEIK